MCGGGGGGGQQGGEEWSAKKTCCCPVRGGAGKATPFPGHLQYARRCAPSCLIDHVLQFNPNPTALEEGHALSVQEMEQSLGNSSGLSKITELVGGGTRIELCSI